MSVLPGQLVRVINDYEKVKSIQGSKPGWTDEMRDCLGKVGFVKLIIPVDNIFIARIKFANKSWTFNVTALCTVSDSDVRRMIEQSNNIREIYKGDFVKISDDKRFVMEKQTFHGGWNPLMEVIIGKVGHVKSIFPDGDPMIGFIKGMQFKVNKECIKIVISRKPESRKFKEGQLVRIISDISHMKSLQRGHGEWTKDMTETLGKHVTINKILPSGDVRVNYDGKIWTINPSALRLPGEKEQQLQVGNHVKLLENKETVQRLQQDHGGYPLGMDMFLGKVGEVCSIRPDGDIEANFLLSQRLILNPLAVVLTEDPITQFELPPGLAGQMGVGPMGLGSMGLGPMGLGPMGITPDFNPETVVDPFGFFKGFKKFMEQQSESGTSGIQAAYDDKSKTFFEEISAGNLPAVKAYISKHGIIEKAPGNGTPLHYAAFHQQIEIVKLLLTHNIKLDALDKLGNTALLIATEKDNFEIAQLLVNANLNTIDISNTKKISPLMMSASKGNVKLVQLFLDLNADTQLVDKEGDSALHAAAINGHSQVVKMLVTASPTLVNLTNKKQNTALHLAAKLGNAGIVSFLIEKEADLELKNSKGRIPLHMALHKEHFQIAELLIQKESPLDEVDNNGFTSLHLATLKGSISCVRLILSLDLDLVDEKKEDGFTAAHIAASLGYQEILQLLLSRGKANPNLVNTKRDTALHIAVLAGHEKCVKCLVQNGAEIDKQNASGNTPLHLALKTTGPANLCLPELFSLITMATSVSQEKRKEIALYLVSNGATLEIKNNEGQNPLDLVDDSDMKKKLLQARPAVSSSQSKLIKARRDRSRSTQRQQIEAAAPVVLTDECVICMVNHRGVVFTCGHSVCTECSDQMVDCPFCKREIQMRIPLIK